MMDLFQTEIINILPHDGETLYYGKIIDTCYADELFNILFNQTP